MLRDAHLWSASSMRMSRRTLRRCSGKQSKVGTRSNHLQDFAYILFADLFPYFNRPNTCIYTRLSVPPSVDRSPAFKGLNNHTIMHDVFGTEE